MMTRSALLMMPLGLVLSSPALADDFQQWVQLSAKVDLSERVVLQDEIVARFSDDGDGLYELENALMLGYKLPGKVTLWGGYVHDPNYSAGDFTVMERRIRQQVTVDDFASLGSAKLSARVRLEQRWRDGVEGTGWRTRPYLKLAIPMGDKTAPTVNLTQEAFINLNTTVFQANDGLDRLRTSATIAFPLTGALKLEAGYLNQHRFVSNGPDTDDHVLTASLGISF